MYSATADPSHRTRWITSMTILDHRNLRKIPDRWISELLARHRARNPKTRHVPSPLSIRAVLNALAISYRPPDRKHSRIPEPYTDETRQQLAQQTGYSAATVGDVLAVLEAHRWIRTIRRGAKDRASCRAMPILELLATVSPDVLSGELPALMNDDLNGINAQQSGTDTQQSGTDTQRNGVTPLPPDIPECARASEPPPPPFDGGAARSSPEPDEPLGDDEIAEILAAMPENMRASWLNGRKHLKRRRNMGDGDDVPSE